MKIGFYGCGHLGGAFLKAMKSSDDEIIVLGRSVDRLDFLRQEYGVSVTVTPEDLAECDIMFLAIKPQDLEGIKPLFTKATVISFLAGVSIQTLQPFFPKSSIIRTLPNLGQSVEKGITLVYGKNDVSLDIKEILEKGSQVIFVKNEKDINALGALTGCGPGVIYYLGEQLKKIALGMGVENSDAEKIAHNLLIGSSYVLDEEGGPLQNMIEKVATKGGITEKVLNSLELENIENSLQKSLQVGTDAMDIWEDNFMNK